MRRRGCTSRACVARSGARLEGRTEDKTQFGLWWTMLVLEGVGWETLDQKGKLAALSNLWGKGRVFDALNKRGTLAALGAPDFLALVEEVLDGPGPRGVELLAEVA